MEDTKHSLKRKHSEVLFFSSEIQKTAKANLKSKNTYFFRAQNPTTPAAQVYLTLICCTFLC